MYATNRVKNFASSTRLGGPAGDEREHDARACSSRVCVLVSCLVSFPEAVRWCWPLLRGQKRGTSARARTLALRLPLDEHLTPHLRQQRQDRSRVTLGAPVSTAGEMATLAAQFPTTRTTKDVKGKGKAAAVSVKGAPSIASSPARGSHVTELANSPPQLPSRRTPTRRSKPRYAPLTLQA